VKRYRILPPVVEAEQFTREHLPKGVTPYNDEKGGLLFPVDYLIAGGATLLYGDWVIYWPDGKRTVCTEAMFSQRYEAINDEA
jgi:hypothetical protein